MKGRRVHLKSELRAALQEMLNHDGPIVLDLIVPYTEHVLPMIPAGKTVREMRLFLRGARPVVFSVRPPGRRVRPSGGEFHFCGEWFADSAGIMQLRAS